MATRFCRKCGAHIPEGVSFCTQCGSPVVEGNAPGPSGTSPMPAQQQMPRQSPKGSSKKPLIIGIIVAAVVIAAIVVAVLFFMNKTASTGSQPTVSTAPVVSSSASSSAAQTSADYILPESDTRYYSEAELEGMDLYSLYIARNEIFARHGRQFNNQDLQDYFSGKSWYNGTIAPDQFNESVLSAIEKKNVEIIGDIEHRRDSPYLK